MITKYGYFPVFVSFLIFCALGGISLLVNNPIIKVGFIVSGISAFLFTLSFFRDPERETPQKSGIVISPADGRVLFIKEVEETKFLNGIGMQISIFMSPLNVHVNRIPMTGEVVYLKHITGDYYIASNNKASEKNERSEIGITTPYGHILFTQVAGFIARRIITNLSIGQGVKAGERFGMIKFGSRVDIIAPANWKIKVKKGDKVTAAETILFEAAN